MQSGKRCRRVVDGIFLLDKPIGLSSNTALQRVKRQFNATKAGHTGTLDPLASGLLPICFGEATKFSAGLLDADKRYLAEIRLGIETDTGDAEGAVTAQRPVVVSSEEIAGVLKSFTGVIEQMPPMYSALKRDGKPLYEYARAGVVLERESRTVVIHELVFLGYKSPVLSVDVRCSKGTYIRSLAMDIGAQLGCGAHLSALRRTAVGNFTINHSHDLSAIEDGTFEVNDSLLLPVDALVRSLPEIRLDSEEAKRIGHGQRLPMRHVSGNASGRYRLVGLDSRFIGIGHLQAGVLHPERLVVGKI